MKKLGYRINHQIQAPEVRLIDEQGKQIGIFSLSEALKKAHQNNLDLVEIAPKAKPPVVKLIDYAKFKYLEEKKRKKEKQKNKSLKELRLTPFIGENDLNRLIQKAADFLQQGHKVKVVVKFTGRTLNYQDFGRQALDKVIKQLEEFAFVEQPAKMVGRRLVVTLGVKKK